MLDEVIEGLHLLQQVIQVEHEEGEIHWEWLELRVF
jgi:hypothetical protein